MTICALCGEPIIVKKPKDHPEAETDEHVPALQFFPKSIRPQLKDRLWKVPSHRKCNAACKSDEEYFYHVFYGLVGAQNAEMGKVMLDDLKRRAKHRQTQGLIKQVLKGCTFRSPSGLYLPPGMLRIGFNILRVQNVAVKVAQCLFYRQFQRYLPRKCCQHFEICHEPEDMQPLFLEMCQLKPEAVDPRIFCYRHIEIDGIHYFSMIFWGAFMFCMAFEEPANVPATT